MPQYISSLDIIFIFASGNIIYGMRFITLNSFFSETNYKPVFITYFIGCCILSFLLYVSDNIKLMAIFYMCISIIMYLFLTIKFLKTKKNIKPFAKLK